MWAVVFIEEVLCDLVFWRGELIDFEPFFGDVRWRVTSYMEIQKKESPIVHTVAWTHISRYL
jgi:hypothetical protein